MNLNLFTKFFNTLSISSLLCLMTHLQTNAWQKSDGYVWEIKCFDKTYNAELFFKVRESLDVSQHYKINYAVRTLDKEYKPEFSFKSNPLTGDLANEFNNFVTVMPSDKTVNIHVVNKEIFDESYGDSESRVIFFTIPNLSSIEKEKNRTNKEYFNTEVSFKRFRTYPGSSFSNSRIENLISAQLDMQCVAAKSS